MKPPLFRRVKPSRIILVSLLLLMYFLPANGQNFDWALATGSVSISALSTERNKVCVDGEGNVYVMGTFEDTVDFDPSPNVSQLPPLRKRDLGMFLAKYDANGNYLWAKCVASSIEGVIIDGLCVSNESEGRVSLAFSTGGKIYYNTRSGIDSNLNGSTANRGAYLFGAIAQYTKDGDFCWIKVHEGVSAHRDVDTAASWASGSVYPDQHGNVYLAGIYQGAVDFDPGSGTAHQLTSVPALNNQMVGVANAYIAKYDNHGKCIWVKSMGGDGINQSGSVRPNGIDVDSFTGDIYMTGDFNSGTIDFDPGPAKAVMAADTGADIFIVKLDSSGGYQWAKKMGGYDIERSYGIKLGELGGLYITGLFYSTDADFDPGPDTVLLPRYGLVDMFIARYDTMGNYCWAKAIGQYGAATQSSNLMTDNFDNVYITGGFYYGPSDFDPGPGAAILPNTADIWNTFIAKYDICGNYVWAGSIPTGYKVAGYSIYVQPRDEHTTDVYVSGQFVGSPDFDPGIDTFTMTSRNNFDWYLMKMNFLDSARSHLVNLKVDTCKSYQLNEILYTTSGQYQQVIPLGVCCDSIIMLDLTITPMEEPIITVDTFLLGLTHNFSSYQWFKDGVLIPGATQATCVVIGNGDYRVIVNDPSGCTDTSEIYIVNNYRPTGIDLLGSSQLQVYPNPAMDRIYINSDEPLNVRLTDMEGRVVLNQRTVNSISVAHLSEGIYLLYIIDRAHRLLKVQKMVKSR